MDTIDNWLDTINEKEKENNFFYKSPITDIDIEFFYISNKNIITDKKTITYSLSQPNKLNKKDVVYLLSKHNKTNYKLLDILVYQMSLPANELHYMDSYNGLKSIKTLDDILYSSGIQQGKGVNSPVGIPLGIVSN